MIKIFRALLSAAATALVFAVSAVAAPTTEGVTTSDIVAALRDGLNVEQDAKDPGLIFAQGKNHLIGVWGHGCDNTGRCKGITYLGSLKTAPSTTYANQFNRDNLHVKVYINDKGKGYIVIEQLVWGGVTSDNILKNALMLMVNMTDYNKANGIVASIGQKGPSARLSHDINQAMAQQWLGNFQRTFVPLRADENSRMELRAAATQLK